MVPLSTTHRTSLLIAGHLPCAGKTMIPDELLSRGELTALTGMAQPKRMCAWLTARGWVFEQPGRRGDIPKVSRAYRDARLMGQQPGSVKKRADYSFMTQPA
jgi:hypothetical protein